MKITANQVTIARIVLLPIPCALLLYGGMGSWWVAFAIFTLLGATDFVDGFMARREGPTKLGGLLDPVADKIFLAATTLSMTAVGIFPGWVAGAIMARELLVTALRSCVELRGEAIHTSTLAKIKTIFQMGALGTIFLTLTLPKYWLIALMLLLAIGLGVVSLYYQFAKRRKVPMWIHPVLGAFLFVAALRILFTDIHHSILIQIIVIVAITWISGLDYIRGSYKIFSASGLNRQDVARIIWATAFGIGVVPIVGYFPAATLPILLSISCELGLAGIDNVVAAQKHHTAAVPFVVTSVAGLLFTVFTYLNLLGYVNVDVVSIAAALAVISIGTFVVMVKRWQHLFKF